VGELKEAYRQVQSMKKHLKGNIFAEIDSKMMPAIVDIRHWTSQGPTRKGVSLKAEEWEKFTTLLELFPSLIPDYENFLPCDSYHITIEEVKKCTMCTPRM
jgi:hypothetical protein